MLLIFVDGDEISFVELLAGLLGDEKVDVKLGILVPLELLENKELKLLLMLSLIDSIDRDERFPPLTDLTKLFP